MSAPLTVYTLPNCIQCTLTKRALDNAGLPYTVVDLTKNEDAAAQVKLLGFRAAPVVFDGPLHWSGFQPDRIAAAVAARTQGGAR